MKQRCRICGESMTPGENCFLFEDEYYHENCFTDAAVDILLELGAREASLPNDEEIAGDLECDRRREEHLIEGDDS